MAVTVEVIRDGIRDLEDTTERFEDLEAKTYFSDEDVRKMRAVAVRLLNLSSQIEQIRDAYYQGQGFNGRSC